MRQFTLILIRRFLFRSRHSSSAKGPAPCLYDQLSSSALTNLENLLLHSLEHERVGSVRNAAVDTVCDVANHGMHRGRPWHQLQSHAFQLAQSTDSAAKETAFRLFKGCPNLVVDLGVDSTLKALQSGLQDSNVPVRVYYQVGYACLINSSK